MEKTFRDNACQDKQFFCIGNQCQSTYSVKNVRYLSTNQTQIFIFNFNSNEYINIFIILLCFLEKTHMTTSQKCWKWPLFMSKQHSVRCSINQNVVDSTWCNWPMHFSWWHHILHKKLIWGNSCQNIFIIVKVVTEN